MADKKYIYLVGDQEQGCGFSPIKAFATETERNEYLRVQAEIVNQYGLLTFDSSCETDEIEIYDVKTAIEEFRSYAIRKTKRHNPVGTK